MSRIRKAASRLLASNLSEDTQAFGETALPSFDVEEAVAEPANEADVHLPDLPPVTTSEQRGILYLVATPIGNLEDITVRALRILREADIIAAEDTRVTRKLLSHFDIHTPLVPYHAHTSASAKDALVARLIAGQSIALVSDAGTPCLSDPGMDFVQAAIGADVRVEPIPGACAAVCALIASGLPTGRFVFEGFLPRSNDRRDRLREVVRERRTVILYEAPLRVVDTLNQLGAAAEAEGVLQENRQVVVAREITKKFEEFVRGTFAEVTEHFREKTPRGECVIVLEGATHVPDAAPPVDLDTLLRDALDSGLSGKDAAKQVAAATKQPRNIIYARVLELRDEAEETETCALP